MSAGKRCKLCRGKGFTLRLTGTHVEAEGCGKCGGKPPTRRRLEALIHALLAASLAAPRKGMRR